MSTSTYVHVLGALFVKDTWAPFKYMSIDVPEIVTQTCTNWFELKLGVDRKLPL